ncbi:hypothetical protein HanPI659440_Chr00c07g0717651 [Helianthus annuus]|nr:hypothetical protein HanPI659440_Chr00c07g0717651 [Helianthus annuus]
MNLPKGRARPTWPVLFNLCCLSLLHSPPTTCTMKCSYEYYHLYIYIYWLRFIFKK